MIGIHSVHRKLAKITWMNMDMAGCITIGNPELRQILALLKENLALVQELDALKELAFQAHLVGDMEWKSEICGKIDELENQMI